MSNNVPSSSPLQAAVVALDRAESIRPFGLDMKILLSTEASGGAISVLMGWLKPGEGPADHFHADRDEMFHVVEGTLELTIGGKTSTAGRGATVFIPRGTVHRFKNVGDTPLCMLDWTLPGGQDHYFKAISDLAARGSFTPEAAVEINRKFDTTFISPH